MKLKLKKRIASPPDPPKKNKKPIVDPVRQRELQRLNAETYRLLAAVDQKKRYATVRGLDEASNLLRNLYQLIDRCEEMK